MLCLAPTHSLRLGKFHIKFCLLSLLKKNKRVLTRRTLLSVPLALLGSNQKLLYLNRPHFPSSHNSQGSCLTRCQASCLIILICSLHVQAWGALPLKADFPEIDPFAHESLFSQIGKGGDLSQRNYLTPRSTLCRESHPRDETVFKIDTGVGRTEEARASTECLDLPQEMFDFHICYVSVVVPAINTQELLWWTDYIM